MKTSTAVALLCAYVILSSLAFYDLSHVFVHIVNFFPSLFIWWFFSKKTFHKSDNLNKPFIVPLSVFPISVALMIGLEIFINPAHYLLIHVCYVLMVHIVLLYQLRALGGRMLSFTKRDYVVVYPIIVIDFLLFGILFLSKIPDNLLVLTMSIASFVMILIAHLINRKANKKPYSWGITGGIFFILSDFIMAYDSFIQKSLTNDILIKILFYVGILSIYNSFVEEEVNYKEKAPRAVSLEAEIH